MKWIASIVLQVSVRLTARRIGHTAPFRHVRLLTSLGEPAGPYMVPLMNHPSAEVRAAAFKAMRILKVPDEAILRGVDLGLRTRVDAHLIGCAGRLPGTDAFLVLTDLLKREPGWQDAIVRAMGNLRDPRALPVLSGLLARDSDAPGPGSGHVLDAIARIEGTGR